MSSEGNHRQLCHAEARELIVISNAGLVDPWYSAYQRHFDFGMGIGLDEVQ